MPVDTSAALSCGTSTNTRSVPVCSRWNSSPDKPGLPGVPPAVTSVPTSTLRAVITPSNGALTASYDTSSFRCATFACADASIARFAFMSATFVSVSCCDTDCDFSMSCQRCAVDFA